MKKEDTINLKKTLSCSKVVVRAMTPIKPQKMFAMTFAKPQEYCLGLSICLYRVMPLQTWVSSYTEIVYTPQHTQYAPVQADSSSNITSNSIMQVDYCLIKLQHASKACVNEAQLNL